MITYAIMALIMLFLAFELLYKANICRKEITCSISRIAMRCADSGA